MRQAILDPTVLDRLRPSDPLRSFQAQLLAGSFLADPGDDPRVEAQMLKEVQQRLVSLWHLEERVERCRHPLSWAAGGVRKRDAAMIVGFYGVVFRLAWGNAPINGVLKEYQFAFGILLLSMIPMLVMLVGREQQRRRAFAAERHAYALRVMELLSLIEELSTRSFVITGPAAILVSAPHLQWLGHRLRDLRESRAPVEPPERRDLVADLRTEHERIEGRVRRIRAGERVKAEELCCDVADLGRRFAALKVRAATEGERLARGLGMVTGAAG